MRRSGAQDLKTHTWSSGGAWSTQLHGCQLFQENTDDLDFHVTFSVLAIKVRVTQLVQSRNPEQGGQGGDGKSRGTNTLTPTSVIRKGII